MESFSFCVCVCVCVRGTRVLSAPFRITAGEKEKKSSYEILINLKEPLNQPRCANDRINMLIASTKGHSTTPPTSWDPPPAPLPPPAMHQYVYYTY